MFISQKNKLRKNITMMKKNKNEKIFSIIKMRKFLVLNIFFQKKIFNYIKFNI